MEVEIDKRALPREILDQNKSVTFKQESVGQKIQKSCRLKNFSLLLKDAILFKLYL